MAEIDEEIIKEIMKETNRMLWSLAHNTKIPGYGPEDLMQEMTIEIWKVIKNNKYNPDQCKETSYFYRVAKNCLRNLNRSKIVDYNKTKPEKREYRDCLDQKVVEFMPEKDQKGYYPASFVENFSESFKNHYF